MLASFILGVVAGAVAPHLEPHVKDFAEGTVFSEPPLSATELPVLSFAFCLLAAGLLTAAVDGGSGAGLALGGLVGVLVPRIRAMLRKRREPDYGDDI